MTIFVYHKVYFTIECHRKNSMIPSTWWKNICIYSVKPMAEWKFTVNSCYKQILLLADHWRSESDCAIQAILSQNINTVILSSIHMILPSLDLVKMAKNRKELIQIFDLKDTKIVLCHLQSMMPKLILWTNTNISEQF